MDFITHSSNSSQSIIIVLGKFPEPQLSQDDVKRSRWHLHTKWVVLQKKNNLNLENQNLFWWEVSRLALRARVIDYLYHEKLFAILASLRRSFRVKAVRAPPHKK